MRALGCLLLVTGLTSIASAQSQRLPTRTMDVSLHQADIRNVLRLFAEVGDVNIVYGEDVSGTVSLRLRNARWDQALRAILASKGLDMQWDGRILRIATSETLERERAARLADRETCEATAPLRTRILRLSYAQAASVAPIVRARLTERGRVEIDARTNSLIVTDVACP